MRFEEIAGLVAIETKAGVKAKTRRTTNEFGQLGLTPAEQSGADTLINQPVKIVHMTHTVRQ